MRVLLVEDDPADARRFEELLAGSQLDVEHHRVSSLEQALAAARGERPDLLVLDLDPSDGEGLETVRRVVRALPGVPVVAVTSASDLVTASEALGAGAVEYLRKGGLTPELLARALRRAIDRHRTEKEAERHRHLSRSILASLPEHVAVLDSDGEILAVNDAWRRFAGEEGGDPRGYEGENYLDVTARSADAGSEDAGEVHRGLRAVLAGERDFYAREYPCHGPDERRWYRVQIAPLRSDRAEGAVVSHTDITERMERDRFLTTLTENLPGVLYRCRNDRDWTMEYLSAGIRSLTGYEMSDHLGPEGPDYADLVHPEDRQRIWREVQEAVAEARPFQLEYRIRTREGEEKWVWEQGRAIPESDGEELLEGYIVDVTDRIEARRRLEEAERKWSSVVDLAPVGIVISDAETGRFRSVNQTVASMLGYEPEEAIGLTADDLGIWVDRERRDELLARLRERGIVRNEEIRLRHKSGEVRYTRSSARLLELGGEERLVWTVQDVTERREREAALRESEARHRTLVETMAEATVIMDGEGRITFANAAAEEMLGLERSELTGRTYDDPDWHLTYPDGRPIPASRLPFRRVMETGEPVRNIENAIELPDGSRRVLSVNTAPMGGGDDEPPAGVVATFRDVTEQKRLERQLEHQALHDPLTGLANRTLFEDRLRLALKRSRREREPMGLLMLDINSFKRINDHLGHTVGDHVLEEVSRRLEAAVRETDTVARWGGDEFAVVLPDLTGPSDVEGLQARIRERVETPIRTAGQEIEIGLTTGGVVQSWDPETPRTVRTEEPEDLVRFADLALHRAKHIFTGSFYLFDPADEIEAVPSLRLEQDLRRGLQDGEIGVHYQPIYRLPDGGLWGFEALARWHHPERGLVPPAEFIPLAERVGGIHEIGAAVLEEAATQMVDWSARLPAAGDLRISINLSARQLQDPAVVDRIFRGLEAAGLPPERVVVEVTETVLMKSPGRVDELKEVGIDVFIDDFGTGYSTFTYLRELNADGLKVDMSFVRDLPESASDAAIVESIVTLGLRLGLEVVAEGIEQEGQLASLEQLGCSLGQGFHLGRPLPAEEVEELLEGAG